VTGSGLTSPLPASASRRSGIRERVLARLAEQAHGATMPDEVAGSAASVSSSHGRNWFARQAASWRILSSALAKN